MVARFNPRNDGEMFEEVDGGYVDAEDYDEVCRLLKRVKDSLETSVPLRGDTTQEPLIAEIEIALEEG